jgi:Cytochrome oxidase complex assembly protein 1
MTMSTTPHIATPNNAEPDQMPPDIGSWNWGAFLLNWIWGVCNATPIALLTFVPLVGFAMPFVLGVKGNDWAWRNKRWDSVAHFKRVQRHWAIAGFIVWACGIALLVAIFTGAFAVINNSEAYKLGVSAVQTSPIVANALGTPITAGGSKEASISTNGDNGKAALDFPVGGPKASGMAFVEAVKKNGVWSLTRLYLKLDGKDSVIDIVGSSPRDKST